MQDSVVIDVQHISKSFYNSAKKRHVFAVNDVSFQVRRGEIVGLLGPNGAGKTTTIQMLLGLMAPTSGNILFFNQNMLASREKVLPRINHASGYGRLPWKLSVYENLTVFAHLYDIKDKTKKIREVIQRFEGEEFAHQTFQSLSAGQKTRSLLMKALLNDPEVLLLDEPTASLDPEIAQSIRNFILDEQRNHQLTVLITSHNMKEVEMLCDRIIFLSNGSVLATDTPQGLAKRITICTVELRFTNKEDAAQRLAKKLGYSWKKENETAIIQLPEKKLGDFLHTLAEQGSTFSDIDIIKPNLEDFFLHVEKGEKT